MYVLSRTNITRSLELGASVPPLPILFKTATISRSWLKVLSLTPELLATRMIVPCGAPSSMHAADTLSPSLLMAQMSAKESRNFRFRRRSLGVLITCESSSRPCIVGSPRTGSSMRRRTAAWMKRLRTLPVNSMGIIFDQLFADSGTSD